MEHNPLIMFGSTHKNNFFQGSQILHPWHALNLPHFLIKAKNISNETV